jgi:hypothetical protein
MPENDTIFDDQCLQHLDPFSSIGLEIFDLCLHNSGENKAFLAVIVFLTLLFILKVVNKVYPVFGAKIDPIF